MARPRKRRWPPSGPCRNRCCAGSTGRPCRPRCLPGAARNALDCALLDLEAKTSGQRVWNLLGRPAPDRLHHRLYDLAGVAGGDGGGHRQGRAPATAQDQAWRRRRWRQNRRGAQGRTRFRTDRRCQRGLDIRQSRAKPDGIARKPASPWSSSRFPPARTRRSQRIRRPLAVCADESVHDRKSLDGLRERYDAVNIKLDKTGGLTEALVMADAAQALGFQIMIGCMVATSLAMAPAMLLAPAARFVDLDGPLLLARDRDGGLRYDGSLVYPPEAALWG